MVIPPGNFSTSNENGLPNKDVVKRRNNWRVTRDSKDSFIKLSVVLDIFEFLASGSIANTTFAEFDPPKGSTDKITTCSEDGEDQPHNQ